MKNFPIKKEFSSGCVVYKNKKSPLFLLGKHSGYHKWVLPKGMIESGEKGTDTAIRETKEEMGVEVALIGNQPIYFVKYFFVGDYQKPAANDQRPQRRVLKYQEEGGKKIKVFKTVSFYLAQYISGDPKNHGWEMEDAGWFTLENALEQMSFKAEKEALQKAYQLLKAD